QLIFWPDGKTLASAGGQTARLWDVTNPARGRALSTLQGHRESVNSLALMPDNTTLLSGSVDCSVRVWNTAASRRERKHFTLPIPVGPWCFAPDSKSVVTLDFQGHVTRWQGIDFQDAQLSLELGMNVDEACISADGRWLAASWTGGEVRVWDLQ